VTCRGQNRQGKIDGLREDVYQGIGQGVFHSLSGAVTQDRAVAAVIGQKLAQYFFRSDEGYQP